MFGGAVADAGSIADETCGGEVVEDFFDPGNLVCPFAAEESVDVVDVDVGAVSADDDGGGEVSVPCPVDADNDGLKQWERFCFEGSFDRFLVEDAAGWLEEFCFIFDCIGGGGEEFLLGLEEGGFDEWVLVAWGVVAPEFGFALLSLFKDLPESVAAVGSAGEGESSVGGGLHGAEDAFDEWLGDEGGFVEDEVGGFVASEVVALFGASCEYFGVSESEKR